MEHISCYGNDLWIYGLGTHIYLNHTELFYFFTSFFSKVEGTAYIGSFIYKNLDSEFLWPNKTEPGANLLDSGAPFYDTYQTADGKYMAVGALEPKFYDRLLKGMLMLHRQPNLDARKGVTYSYICCRGRKLTIGHQDIYYKGKNTF